MGFRVNIDDLKKEYIYRKNNKLPNHIRRIQRSF